MHPQFTRHIAKHDFAAGLSSMDPVLLSLWVASFVSFIPAYGFAVALITGFALYSRFRDAELQVAALEREWSAARLAALRMQLSPHSLFNLLHTIRGLHRMGSARRPGHGGTARPSAAASVARRATAISSARRRAARRDRCISNCSAVAFRTGSAWTCPEPAADPGGDRAEPILQPLVENAVLHGIGRAPGRSRITITGAHVAGELLYLQR